MIRSMKRELMPVALLCVTVLSSDVHAATRITLSTDPALSGSQMMDFDSETLGSFVARKIDTVTFSYLGELGSNGEGFTIQAATEGGVYGDSGLSLQTEGAGCPTHFEYVFDQPVSAYGHVWGGASYAFQLDLFDSNNMKLDSWTIDVAPGYVTFVGASSATSIKRVEMTQIAGGSTEADWVKIDDLQFVTVPEPANFTMLVAGVAAVLSHIWRRRYRG